MVDQPITPPAAPADAAVTVPSSGSTPTPPTPQGGDAPPAAGPDGKTIIGGGANADKSGTAPADWPADWRQKGLTAAGVDDKAALSMLERLGSPGDLVKKVLEQEKLISQGKQRQALPKDATDEQKAAYRKEIGVPETADKYDLTMSDGLVIGENDKPIIDNILKAAHGANLTNDQLKPIIAAYYQQQKQVLMDRQVKVAENQKTVDDELHKEWGGEYRANLNAIENLTGTFSQETNNALKSVVDADGNPLLNNKSFIKDMLLLAKERGFDVVPGATSGMQMSSVEDEIAALHTQMRDGESPYWKGPKVSGGETKGQIRYRELVDFQERNKKK